MTKTLSLAFAATCLLAASAFAQPRITVTTIGDDLSASGGTVCGWLYDAPLGHYAPFKWTQGVGFQRLPGTAPGSGGALSCSADGSALASAMNNTTNWEGLNCFSGYDAQGVARPPLANCVMRGITHRYTAASGWVNGGSLARTIDPATGRWVGGTTCDATINSSNDISANGRYIVGGAYSAVAINSAGNPSFGFCGDFFAFRWDSQTGEFLKLATSSHTTRADRVNADGSTVVGYDIGMILDAASGTSYPERRLSVWYNNVQTILDTGGSQDSAPVNGPGTMVAAGASPAFCLTNFGVNRTRLVKWTRTGSTWTPVNLGRPADRIDELTILQFSAIYPYGISDDGNTIVGNAKYGNAFRPFIWRPTINGGVPMDLADYLATLDPTGATTGGVTLTAAYGLSADGNNILFTGEDSRTFCTAPAMTLPSFVRGVLTLNAATQATQAPSIAMGPSDEATRCTWAGWGTVFNVFAGGTWPLSYQWQREDPANPNQWISLTNACSGLPEMDFPHDTSWEYEGVTGPQLRVNVIAGDSSHDGRYRVVVSNAYGSVTSEPASLTFLGAINPLTPVDATGCSASPATFTVGAIPGGVEERWEVCTDAGNDVWAIMQEGVNDFPELGGVFNATGTRTGTVTINPGTLPATATYQFRCHIADSCSTLESNPATLTIGSPCGYADMGAQGGIPAACGDGILDNNDFVVFIDYFFQSNHRADVGMQGGVPGSDNQWDNNDFVVFIDMFFSGC